MEKEIKIPTGDGHLIYGTLTYPKKKSDKLIIFVHGLTGYRNEHIFYNAAKFFSPIGFTVLRFDLYSGKKKARSLKDCAITTHAQDLNRVIRYFRNKFKKIYLVGHSLGGATILISRTDIVDGIILWDSFCSIKKGLLGIDKYMKYNKKLDAYILSWGMDYIVSKKFHKERSEFPTPKEIVPKIKKPIKIIVAGKGILVKSGEEYYKYANKPKAFALIKNAGHTFDEEGTEEKLFHETLDWIKRF